MYLDILSFFPIHFIVTYIYVEFNRHISMTCLNVNHSDELAKPININAEQEIIWFLSHTNYAIQL